MDILMLTMDDWANSMARYKMCAESLGLKVEAYKGREHKFRYPEQVPIHKELASKRRVKSFPGKYVVRELRELAEKTKIIHYFAGTFIDTGIDLSAKKVVVQHGTDAYLKESKAANDLFNPVVDVTVMQYPELLGRGAKNEKWISYPVDTGFLKTDYRRRDDRRVLIGHWPSSPDVKGTLRILSVIERMEKDGNIAQGFKYVGTRDAKDRQGMIPWVKHLERVRECDVYIEAINEEYGGFCNSALEAAALGKVSVTQCRERERYLGEYGPLPLCVANDIQQLDTVLRSLVWMQPEELADLRVRTRLWIERTHSIEAIGRRLWDGVYKELIS